MVDVIIPTYNNFKSLQHCLLALQGQTYQNFCVWVGIDGSTDETYSALPNWILQLSYPITLLSHSQHKNQGRAATRNLALAQGKGTYTWFLDSDMCPAPNCLEAHLALLAHYPQAISLGAIHYQEKKQYPWANYLSQRGHAKYTHLQELSFNYFVAANTVLPSTFFSQVQGFDANIARYGGEDMEFAYRVFQTFHPKFLKNDEAITHTLQPKNIPQGLAQLEEYGQTGLPYIYEKHPQFPAVYHIDKFYKTNKQFKARLFRFLLCPLGRRFMKKMLWLPKPFKTMVLNYLVIAALYQGWCKKYKSDNQ